MRRGWFGVAWLIGAALAGCASGGPLPTTPSPATPATPTSAGFTNPVWDSNFPDPMIIDGGDGKRDGPWWAFATNGNGANVQTLRSTDLVTWEQGPDALPKLAGWTAPGDVWAPEVAVHGPNRFVLYYTTQSPDAALQCVSTAVAADADGPYRDSTRRPLICEEKFGGAIDAHPFTTSSGERYLYWKNDGNRIGTDTWIWVQRLDDSGTKLVGRAKRLFQQDLPWEGELVEAPFLWENGGRFYLFYSANAYASPDYAVGVAVADSPAGPFTKKPEPILVSNEVAAGPGHCALFERDGAVWMVYHAWAPDAVGSEVPGRAMWLSEVTFSDDGTVAVTPPTVAYPARP